MFTQIEINGSTLVPLKDAAKVVSYSRDYLAKLAREKKVVATQVGRQWFVDMDSLQKFVDDVTLEQEIRNQHLREERRQELLAKENFQTLANVIKRQTSTQSRYSFLFSSLVMALGLFVGAVFYTASDIFDFTNVFNTDITASSLVSREQSIKTELEAPTPQVTTIFTEVTDYPLFVDEAEVRDMRTGMEGIFLLAREGEVKDQVQIGSLFSDEVTVEFLDESTGVVRYEYEDGEVKEYPFVSVPKTKTMKQIPDRPSS